MVVTGSWIKENYDQLDEWQQSAFDHLSSMMSDKQNLYPCVPGQQAFLDDTLRYGFVNDPREDDSIRQLGDMLKHYGEISRDTGKYASFAAIFDTSSIKEADSSVETFRDLLWSILNRLHHIDEKPWPEGIPTDPYDQAWEFCFNGEPYFAFCATPAHSVRKSRYFPYLLIAFQPRWVFEAINGSTSLGQKLKQAIRKRLLKYDGVDPHPDLKWYGDENNYEWKQYFLSDDQSSPSKCPFMAMKNKIKSLRS